MTGDGGLSSFQRRMRAIPAGVRQAVRPALQQGAEEVADAQRKLAPVDDGALIASIRIEAGENELSLAIAAGGPMTVREVRKGAGAHYDYALAQEFGTADQEDQAFFWPGFRLARRRAVNRIKRAIGKAIKGAK